MLTVIFYFFVFESAVKVVIGKSTRHAQQPSDRIIGGHDVDITQFPHQVSIQYNGSHSCGGSIISDQYVLTAAHCFIWIGPRNFTVRTGSTFWEKDGEIHDVLSATIHPKFQLNIETDFDYDIAILKTTRMKLNGETMKAVQLAGAGGLKPGDNVVVTGWGVTVTGNFSTVLQAVSLPVMDRALCQQVYNQINRNITERMFCALSTEPAKSACQGDSGGAVLAESTLLQYGIVSFRIAPGNCEKRYPNVFTNVPEIRGWIRDVTGV